VRLEIAESLKSHGRLHIKMRAIINFSIKFYAFQEIEIEDYSMKTESCVCVKQLQHHT